MYGEFGRKQVKMSCPYTGVDFFAYILSAWMWFLRLPAPVSITFNKLPQSSKSVYIVVPFMVLIEVSRRVNRLCWVYWARISQRGHGDLILQASAPFLCAQDKRIGLAGLQAK